MKIQMKWLAAALLIAAMMILSCKIIGVDDEATTTITFAIEHSWRTIAPGNDPHTRTFTPEEYWDEDFNDWDITSADLTDIQVSVWDVSTAERTVSARFTLTFVDPAPPANPLVGSTQILTLGECIDGIIHVWNNKVTINTPGKIRLLSAIQNKKPITLSAPVQNLSGTCDFWTKAVIKIQVNLKKK